MQQSLGLKIIIAALIWVWQHIGNISSRYHHRRIDQNLVKVQQSYPEVAQNYSDWLYDKDMLKIILVMTEITKIYNKNTKLLVILMHQVIQKVSSVFNLCFETATILISRMRNNFYDSIVNILLFLDNWVLLWRYVK